MKFPLVAVVVIVACLVDDSHGRTGFGSGEQEWGYVTVRPRAHMFWWLYYTTANVTSYYDKPLVIWLQGGPGSSSTGYGNFAELGPLDVHLKERNYTWVKDYNVLFVDNPVGTGFSYAEDPKVFPRTNREIAEDLLECMRGFLSVLPNFGVVPTYITSESYGGKMAAEFANVWYQAIESKNVTGNLKGVAMGDSWISPIDSVTTWAPFLLNAGVIDSAGYEEIEKAANATKDAVDNENWSNATQGFFQTEYVILGVANNVDFYNILSKKNSIKTWTSSTLSTMQRGSLADIDAAIDALMNGDVKEALGLNRTWGKQSSDIFDALREDFMKPAVRQVEILLNATDLTVVVFTGQLDLIVDTPGTLHWVERLDWRNATNWLAASRCPVVVDGIIEGYIKEYDNFKMYWINRSGHMVPTDNPVATAAMLKDLTSDA